MEKAPLYTDVTHDLSGGQAYWLRATDGARIRVGVWREGKRGTVFMFPGRTEYVEKYVHVAAAMREAGYATLIIDWRGQGLADRPLADRMMGHVGSFDEYQRDVAATLAAANRLGLPEPYYMIAHSMGGCIGLRALYRGFQAKAAVFSGPMWGIRMTGPQRPFAWTYGLIARTLQADRRYAPTTGPKTYVAIAPYDGNTLTSDPEMYAMMRRQVTLHPDLALGGPTVRWLTEALLETRALRAMPAPKIAAVTAMGSNERVVDTQAVRDKMAAWPGGRLDIYPGGEHEVVMERPEHLKRFFAAAIALFERNR